jgi:phage antirepressor YoqD-like protein
MPFTGWPDQVTAKDIAKALDISDKTLRAWLRKNPQVIHAHGDYWIVTPDDADAIVAAYRSRK